jgi:TPR repeat protein
MLRYSVIIACFLLGAVLLSALSHKQARSAEPSSASVPVQDCDRLVLGVELVKIDGKAAQEACERAIRAFPGESRFKPWLARALESLNRLDESRKWLRLAADQRNPYAQAMLGLLYERGIGVSQDYTEALKWFRLAADQGFLVAQYELGVVYEKGNGVPQSNAEAVKWYRLAAKQGHKDAQTALRRLGEASP